MNPTSGTKAIGAAYDLTLSFNGSLDEIAIYNYALTLARVQAHFVAGGGVLATAGGDFPYLGGGYYGQAA